MFFDDVVLLPIFLFIHVYVVSYLSCLVDVMRNIPQSMNSIIDFHCWWQIYDVLNDAGKPCGVRSVCVYGGTLKQPQITALQSGVVSYSISSF